jgi:hypothetical protein
MPQAVGAAIVTFFSSTTLYVVVIRTILINVALGYLAKKLSKRADNSIPPLNVTLRGTIEPRHIILGKRRAGGVLVFYGATSSGGNTNDLLWYVIVYAGHQVAGMGDVWIDTERIDSADIGVSTGEVTGGKFTASVWVWKHLGTDGQVVDANIDSAFAEFTADHRLRGLAYAVVKLKRSSEVFQSAPSTVSVLVDGALIYDPRLDSTNGGSGSHRAENPSTWEFSRNPALHALWYLTGGSVVNDLTTRMVKYGLRDTYARVPVAYIVAAANICDEVLTGANAPPSGDQPRYCCDLEVSCGESRRDVLNAILETMAGTATLARGQWQLFAGAYDTPVHALTQDDVFGDIEIQDTTPHSERYNAVSATYVDASKQWAENTTPFRTDSSYESQDGSEQIPRELDLRGVTDQYQAQRLSEIELRRSRMQRTVKLVGMLNLLKVAPWETLTYSHARYGWVDRIFRCVERQFEYAEEAGRVTLTCRRDDPGVYTDMATADYTTGISATDVFQGEGPDAPTDFVVQGTRNGIQFSWGIPAFWHPLGVFQILEYSSASPSSSASVIWQGNASGKFITKTDTTVRYYWVRAVWRGSEYSDVVPAGDGIPAAATLVEGGLNAYASPGSASLSTGASSSGTTVSVTVTPSAGTPSYTHSWTWASGGTGITIDAPSAASTTFSASGLSAGDVRSGIARDTVSDSAAGSVTVDVPVMIQRPVRTSESGSITAGQNGTGGAYGYQKSSYGSISGFPGTGGTLSDVKEIAGLRDTNPTAIGGDGLLRITGFASDPGSGYFTSITANGSTKLSSTATYSYLSGAAVWQWSGSPFNFLAGNTYPVTMNF